MRGLRWNLATCNPWHFVLFLRRLKHEDSAKTIPKRDIRRISRDQWNVRSQNRKTRNKWYIAERDWCECQNAVQTMSEPAPLNTVPCKHSLAVRMAAIEQ